MKMKKVCILCAFAAAVLFVCGCGDTSTGVDASSPEAPVWDSLTTVRMWGRGCDISLMSYRACYIAKDYKVNIDFDTTIQIPRGREATALVAKETPDGKYKYLRVDFIAGSDTTIHIVFD